MAYVADVKQYMVTEESEAAYATVEEKLEDYWSLSNQVLTMNSLVKSFQLRRA